ncbi:MAG: ArnT family glycosyltransferase [Aquificaceae bacterium]
MKLLPVFFLVALLSYSPNISKYPFKNEESLRTIVAFEMEHSGNYIQPTLLGEPYFNKPPLFNWLIVAYSYLFGWSETTVRAVSLTFLLLTVILLGLFSYILFRKGELALLSALIFITFGNILFFYGFLGEIDITYTFFIFSGIFSLYLWWRRGSVLLALASGILFGFSVLLKGFPAYAYLILSLFALSLYSKSPKPLFSKQSLLIYLITLIIPLLFFLQVPEPFTYLKTLWIESFSRVGGDFSRLEHMVKYPLINFKDLLPWSFLFLIALYFLRKNLTLPSEIKLLLYLFFINYLPYWISNSAGRYILPLYPLLAVIFSFYIHRAMEYPFMKRLAFGLLILVISSRFLYGLFFFPYAENMETSRKKIAMDILSFVGDGKIACECPEEKSVCLYLGIWKGKPLHRLGEEEGISYVISCEESYGKEIKTYKLKDKKIGLFLNKIN